MNINNTYFMHNIRRNEHYNGISNDNGREIDSKMPVSTIRHRLAHAK